MVAKTYMILACALGEQGLKGDDHMKRSQALVSLMLAELTLSNIEEIFVKEESKLVRSLPIKGENSLIFQLTSRFLPLPDETKCPYKDYVSPAEVLECRKEHGLPPLSFEKTEESHFEEDKTSSGLKYDLLQRM